MITLKTIQVGMKIKVSYRITW